MDDYKGLVVGPTADATYYINVLTTAYSIQLLLDSDESFWTKHHPMALYNAAMYKIEGLLRNVSSAKDYLAAAQQELMGINFDQYEDELQDRWKAKGWKFGVACGSFIFHYRSVTRGIKYAKGKWSRK